jgi:DNA-binding CsgD family transcriptional regulator
MTTATTPVARRHRHHNAQVAHLSPVAHGRDSEVIQALRVLLATLAPQPATVEEEVVLSVELNGVHYSLAHRQACPSPEPVKLSAREREIARLISSGHTNKTVAAVLEISLWTVDTHIRRIFAKLGVRSRSAMVAQLAELGVIGAGD